MTVSRSERPSSVKLVGVKHELYNPRLPTLRRMDMDDACHRLSTEHSRTTTPCSRDDFAKARSTVSAKSEPLHCKPVLSKQTESQLRTYQPLSTRNYTETWNAIVGKLRSGTTGKQPSSPGKPNLQVTGLAMRTKHPALTSSWQRFTPVGPHGNPSRPLTASRIMPAAMYSRYRSAGLRPYSPSPWK